MSYAVQIGLRYLRSKKRQTTSVTTVVAIIGVALGVAALLCVLSITSGFQEEFRSKVLGVNAHVLVLKYGLDFDEYRDVMRRARQMPEVAGAAPFVINDMMLVKGDRLTNVLVKGIDPGLVGDVLDMPRHLIDGSLRGMRRAGATPPVRPDDFDRPLDEDEDLDSFLEALARSDGGLPMLPPDEPDAGPPPPPDTWDAGPALAQGDPPDAGPVDAGGFVTVDTLPEVHVPTPDEMLAELERQNVPQLPDEDIIDDEVARDENADLARLPGIVVGATLARNLGIGVGDRVQLTSPIAGLDISLFSPGTSAPRQRDFRVIGIFEAGFQEYDTRLVYVDLFEAQGIQDQGDTVTGVEIRLHDLEQAPEISRRLERALGGGPFHTMDWQELNQNLFTALEIQKIMLSVVIATIIFVAAFTVVATLIMVVIEKKREVAILKAMGATDAGILAIFFTQGSVVGLIGTILGLLLGGGACLYLLTYEFPLDPKVYLIDHLPVRLSPIEFGVTVITATLISMAATLIPSWWAARLLPADGVRYE